MDSQGMFHLKRKADVFHIPSLPSAVQGLPAAASPILRQKPDHWREGLKAASKIQRSRFQTAQMCSPQQTTPPSCRASRNALATVVEMLWLQSIPTWFLNMLCDVTNFCRAERPQDLLILYYTGLWTLITWKIKICDFHLLWPNQLLGGLSHCLLKRLWLVNWENAISRIKSQKLSIRSQVLALGTCLTLNPWNMTNSLFLLQLSQMRWALSQCA